MMLINIYDYGKKEYTVAEAVEKTLDGSDYDRGELEALKAEQRKTSEMMGRLIEKLLEAHAIKSQALFEVIGYGWGEAE